MPLPENQSERDDTNRSEVPQSESVDINIPQASREEIERIVRETIDHSIRYSEYISEAVHDNRDQDEVDRDLWNSAVDDMNGENYPGEVRRNGRYTVEEIQSNPRVRDRYIEQLLGRSNRELRGMIASDRANPFYIEALKIKSNKRKMKDVDFNDYLSLLKPFVANYENPGYRLSFPNEKMQEYYDIMSHHRLDYDDNGLRAVDYKVPVYGRSFSKLIKNYKMLNKIFRILSATRHPEFFSGEVNFATCKSDGSIEFLPKNRFTKIEEKLKLDEVSGFNETIGRISCKAGKFIQWFLSPKAIEEFNVTQKDIEQFSLILKSGDDYYYKTCKVSVVRGEDIRKYYLEDNYYELGMGTLRGSCMRHERTSAFLDLYVKNPDNVSLVILLKDGKVMARSIMWNVYDYGNVMDRIYYTRDTDVEYLKKWAKNNGILSKQHQTSHQCEEFINPNGSINKLKMCIHLNSTKFETYPYVDTFKYINIEKGLLFNYQDKEATNILNSTGGSCARLGRNHDQVNTENTVPVMDMPVMDTHESMADVFTHTNANIVDRYLNNQVDGGLYTTLTVNSSNNNGRVYTSTITGTSTRFRSPGVFTQERDFIQESTTNPCLEVGLDTPMEEESNGEDAV